MNDHLLRVKIPHVRRSRIIFSFFLLSVIASILIMTSKLIENERTGLNKELYKLLRFGLPDSKETDTISGSFFREHSTEYIHELDKLNKCRHLFEKILVYTDQTDSIPLPISVEALRIYNHCLIDSSNSGKSDNLDDNRNLINMANIKKFFNYKTYNKDKQIFLEDIFPNDPVKIKKVNKFIFPYINFGKDELLWPHIIKLNDININGANANMNAIKFKSLKMNMDTSRFNNNFWSFWLSKSYGKGIIMTMSNDDIDNMLSKLLRVLQYNSNKMPIQIVTTGYEFNDTTILKLAKLARRYEQDVKLIDCSPILNKSFVRANITGFLNKWVSTLFNTFDKFILIDVDTVPFVDMNSFFQIKEFRQTGIYVYKDREIYHEHAPIGCINSLLELKPSKFEKYLNNVNTKFDLFDVNEKSVSAISSTIMDTTQKNEEANDNMELQIFNNFFKETNIHQVDSGLVVIDGKRQFKSLTMAFQIHLSGKFTDCIHGDKEFFWLGPLLAGSDYSIDPINAGIIGNKYIEQNKETGVKMMGICSTQIAHINKDRKLLWTNGGLQTCKFNKAAIKDFEINKDYFTNRYQDVNNLQKIYDSPLNIDSIIVPNPKRIPWMQTRECNQYRFCAYFEMNNENGNTIFNESEKGKDISVGVSYLIVPDESQLAKYNRISQIWASMDPNIE